MELPRKLRTTINFEYPSMTPYSAALMFEPSYPLLSSETKDGAYVSSDAASQQKLCIKTLHFLRALVVGRLSRKYDQQPCGYKCFRKTGGVIETEAFSAPMVNFSNCDCMFYMT
jgi:hypothetical protein